MAKAEITFYTNSFKIVLNTVANDRKQARIKFHDIRTLAMSNDSENIELVFTNGEIKIMSFNNIDKVDADTDITSQQILHDKFEAKLFV